MLVLGRDALSTFRESLDALSLDLNVWEHLSKGTSFELSTTRGALPAGMESARSGGGCDVIAAATSLIVAPTTSAIKADHYRGLRQPRAKDDRGGARRRSPRARDFGGVVPASRIDIRWTANQGPDRGVARARRAPPGNITVTLSSPTPRAGASCPQQRRPRKSASIELHLPTVRSCSTTRRSTSWSQIRSADPRGRHGARER